MSIRNAARRGCLSGCHQRKTCAQHAGVARMLAALAPDKLVDR
jgi:hypothetical protein